jgi:hypothetical protein
MTGDAARRFLSGRDDATDPPSARDRLRDEARLDFLWWLREGEGLRDFRLLLDEGEWCVLLRRFGLSEPRVSNNSRPRFLSRTSSLESLMGDLECLRLRSRLRSRSLSLSLGLSSR